MPDSEVRKRLEAMGNGLDSSMPFVDGKFVVLAHLGSTPRGGKQNRPKAIKLQLRPDPLAR